MSAQMNLDPGYQRARQRVLALRGFYVHLLVFIVVNAFLFALNLITSAGQWWFYWPLLGWGVGLALHAVVALGADNWWGRDWEERKIHELLDKEDKQ